MRLGLQAVHAAFVQTFGYFLPLMAATLITVLLSLPLVVIGVVGGLAAHSHILALLVTILLAVILPNPASAGIQFLAAELIRGEFITLGDLWTGLRRFARPALLIWLLSAFASAVIIANVAVYTHLGGVFGVLRFVWFYILGFWLAMHVYIYPLLMQQESLHPFAVYRDAYVLAAARPATAVTLLFVWLLLLLPAILSGLLVVIGLALFAVMQQNAVQALRRSLEMSGSAPG
jgi:hypothetical protein